MYKIKIVNYNESLMDSVELRKVSHSSNGSEVWLYRTNTNVAGPNLNGRWYKYVWR